MKKPKLLAVVHLPPPYHGASTVGKQFVESKIIQEQFELRTIDLTTSRSLHGRGWKSQLEKIWRSLLLQIRFMGALVVFRPDLVYVTANSSGLAFWKDFLVLLVLKALGIKHCLHFHNKGFFRYDSKPWGRLALRVFFARARAIFLSEILLDDLPNTRNRIHYSICPNGVAPPSIPFGERQSHEILQILFVSNLLVEKGVYELLDACALLKDEGFSFQCKIVGKSGDITEDQLQSRIERNGISDKVIYLGAVYGQEKERLLLNSDVFAFPTYYRKECFPLVLLEALSYGLPIVSTREGGIPDIVKDGVNGFLCEQRDAASLANKLELLLTDAALRKSIGAANRTRYEEKFTQVRFERNMAACLKA